MGVMMIDDIWQRDEIESPCIKICSIHPATRTCVGCHRTMEEIGGWGRMTPEERRAIMDEIPARKSKLTKRKGGRRANPRAS